MLGRRQDYRGIPTGVTFRELNYQAQAKSINAHIVHIQKAMEVHIARSQNRLYTRTICLNQLRRLIQRIEQA
jgi:hypothetical protein